MKAGTIGLDLAENVVQAQGAGKESKVVARNVLQRGRYYPSLQIRRHSGHAGKAAVSQCHSRDQPGIHVLREPKDRLLSVVLGEFLMDWTYKSQSN